MSSTRKKKEKRKLQKQMTSIAPHESWCDKGDYGIPCECGATEVRKTLKDVLLS